MSENAIKVLTRKQANELGFDKLSVITADMLEGYTHIESYAFANRRNLTSITIPNSVTSIGEFAFRDCISLTSVTIPYSITSIDGSAFSWCRNLTSVNIPNSVTSIGKYVFYCCRSLTSIEIPNNVVSIGDGAFAGCLSLTSVTIPNSVTSIGYGAFWGCSSLTSVTIPNSVINIGDETFRGCNFKQEKRIDEQGRVIAYKGFNSDMTCRNFKYKEGETYELECEPILCERGFHACLNPLDCLNYYHGKVGKDVVFHEVYLEGVTAEKEYDSKVVSKKITIGREISLSEMADISSGRK